MLIIKHINKLVKRKNILPPLQRKSLAVKRQGFFLMARQKLAFVRDNKKKDRSHAKRGKAFSLGCKPKEKAERSEA